MHDNPISSTYERPAIESSSDVAGLLTFKAAKSGGSSHGGSRKGRNHS